MCRNRSSLFAGRLQSHVFASEGVGEHCLKGRAKHYECRENLILLDLMTPIVSGWEVLATINATAHLAPISRGQQRRSGRN